MDAEVLAVDDDGHPALLRRAVGNGWLVLCTYPIEYFASMTREVNPEPTWRIYDALATESRVARPVRVPDGRVSASELQHEDGRRFVWFVNNAGEPIVVSPTVEGELRDENGKRCTEVRLEPYGVIVMERVST